MKWILIIAFTLVAIVSVAALAGSRLPRDHLATVRATYRAAPESVWAVIGDPAATTTWRKDLKSVELLASVEGRTAWREESGSGKVSYVMAEWDPPRRMTTRITSDDLPYGGQWEFTLAPAGSGTLLTITERGFVKPALFRFMARTFFGFTSTLEGYHRALGAKLGETATPEVVASGR
ncbi:MAG TPA: SRPBCC domain-containing protein [Gemmatimonadaceae bacterium]|nr:SRPBCC domain-containing protein [Gemmatimonadaceae bacterium]